jgi:hypothetical protein
MFRRLPSLRRLAGFSLALLAAAPAGAQLVATSPFLPLQGSGTAAVTAGAPLEFRGAMEDSNGLRLRIVDPARKAGWWVRLNERDPSFDFVVKQYDADRDTVDLDYHGSPLKLAQHVAKVASAGVAQNIFPMPVVGGGPPMPAAITQSVVLNPTPADEQRRLDVVAAEVAKRRALREQAAQQVSQGMPIAPQVIQQQQQQNNGGQRGGRFGGGRPQ